MKKPKKITGGGWCQVRHRVCVFEGATALNCPLDPNKCGELVSRIDLHEKPRGRGKGFDSSKRYPQKRL